MTNNEKIGGKQDRRDKTSMIVAFVKKAIAWVKA
jgi:hypothetical protein